MTSRDRVINTLCHQISTPVPTLLRIPQYVEQNRADACTQLKTRFQNDVDLVDFSLPVPADKKAESIKRGMSLDEWGCVWERDDFGTWAASRQPRYDDILELEGIRFPKNPITLEMAESINHLCDSDSRFVLVQTRIHPFRRICALGGVKAASKLFQKKPRELREIMTRLFDYYNKQVETWCLTDVDAIGLEDDLVDGHQGRISIQRWNEILVPMYKEFCTRIQRCDKFVFFTGTGDFEEYIPGLIFAGGDCIRFDATAMDAKLLADRYGHRVTFQPILMPEMIESETEETLAEKILALRSAFTDLEIIAECQMPPKASVRQVAAAMLNLLRRMPQTFG